MQGEAESNRNSSIGRPYSVCLSRQEPSARWVAARPWRPHQYATYHRPGSTPHRCTVPPQLWTMDSGETANDKKYSYKKCQWTVRAGWSGWFSLGLNFSSSEKFSRTNERRWSKFSLHIARVFRVSVSCFVVCSISFNFKMVLIKNVMWVLGIFLLNVKWNLLLPTVCRFDRGVVSCAKPAERPTIRDRFIICVKSQNLTLPWHELDYVWQLRLWWWWSSSSNQGIMVVTCNRKNSWLTDCEDE